MTARLVPTPPSLKRHQKNLDSSTTASAAPKTAQPLPTGRLLLFCILALLLPMLLLGLVEVGLRLAGYGYSTGLFKPLRIGDEWFLVENEKFSLRFFPPELARTPGPIRIKPRKSPGTYRIFIMGESAAMGDPEPGYGAGRYLQVLLRERFPEAKFEVINVAFTAINSHVILPIAEDCAVHEGDLWIIYMGNNEMVGPFGAATVFGARAPPLWFVRLNLALQKTRVGQLVAATGQKLKEKSAKTASWSGMQMFLENKVLPTDSRREAVYKNFRSNLEDILRVGRGSGAKMILNTVAVNLKNCPPFSSLANSNLPAADRERFARLYASGCQSTAQGDWVQAAESFALAARIDPQFAELQFRWGDCFARLTNAAAAQHFQLACDYDALPFRTDSRINSLIRETAKKSSGNDLVLLEAATLLATNDIAGVCGEESFYEHVHLNFEGNYHLGRLWAGQVEHFLPVTLKGRMAAGWASQDVCERWLGLTDWNRSIVAEGMTRRMQQPPLSAQSNNSRRQAALQSLISKWRQEMDAAGAARARQTYLEALQRAPEDYCLHENFASFLVATGDIPAATARWQRVRELIPQDYLATFRFGELLARQGRGGEAQAVLSQAADMRPFLSDPWFELGQLHATEGKWKSALENFERARKLRPSDPEYAYQTGRMLALLNHRAEAILQFRQAIQLQPDYWQAHDALGGQLGLDGNIREAKAEFAVVVRLKPDYARAHLNLGVALLKEGQAANAAREFQEALRLEPTNSVAQSYLQQALNARNQP